MKPGEPVLVLEYVTITKDPRTGWSSRSAGPSERRTSSSAPVAS